MELKYVGAKPTVSQRGVNFDQTKPDKYTFLSAAVELLEALTFSNTEKENVHLYYPELKDYSSQKLLELLKQHCENIEDVFAKREEKTEKLIQQQIEKVKENSHLTHDERLAWLGNIDIMHDYFLQYITNESAYDCALHALADKIHSSKIEEVTFPLGRNYGLVMADLIDILRDYKPAYDAVLTFVEKDGQTVGKLDMKRPQPLSN